MMNQHLNKQNGLAIVEFTLIAPLLIFLLIAIGEFGRAYYTFTQVEKISRDSTRYLSNKIIVGDSGSYNLTDQLVSTTKSVILYGSTHNTSTTIIKDLKEEHISIQLNNNFVTTEITYPFQPAVLQLPAFFSENPTSLSFNIVVSYSMRVL